jgi:hypothetical protein
MDRHTAMSVSLRDSRNVRTIRHWVSDRLSSSSSTRTSTSCCAHSSKEVRLSQFTISKHPYLGRNSTVVCLKDSILQQKMDPRYVLNPEDVRMGILYGPAPTYKLRIEDTFSCALDC